MKLPSAYEERASNIPYADSLTCSQLIKIIKSPTSRKKHRTFSEIADEYLSQIDQDDGEKPTNPTDLQLTSAWMSPVMTL